MMIYAIGNRFCRKFTRIWGKNLFPITNHHFLVLLLLLLFCMCWTWNTNKIHQNVCVCLCTCMKLTFHCFAYSIPCSINWVHFWNICTYFLKTEKLVEATFEAKKLAGKVLKLWKSRTVKVKPSQTKSFSLFNLSSSTKHWLPKPFEFWLSTAEQQNIPRYQSRIWRKVQKNWSGYPTNRF